MPLVQAKARCDKNTRSNVMAPPLLRSSKGEDSNIFHIFDGKKEMAALHFFICGAKVTSKLGNSFFDRNGHGTLEKNYLLVTSKAYRQDCLSPILLKGVTLIYKV